MSASECVTTARYAQRLGRWARSASSAAVRAQVDLNRTTGALQSRPSRRHGAIQQWNCQAYKVHNGDQRTLVPVPQVKDLHAVLPCYERLLGRSPDERPQGGLAERQFSIDGWVRAPASLLEQNENRQRSEYDESGNGRSDR